MRNPKRRPPNRAPAPTAPLEPLATLVRPYESWRQAQAGKPARQALREFWAPRDRQHGQRPDYALWRQLHCPDCPPERRQNPVELAQRGLRSPEAEIYWATVALLPSLTHPLQAPLDRPVLRTAPISSEWVRWLATPDRQLTRAQELVSQSQPGWKPGREIEFSWIEAEDWLPVPRVKFARLVAMALSMSEEANADWLLSAWLLMRDQRPESAAARPEELDMLLRAAQAARLAGDHFGAVRLTALLAHLVPPNAPAMILERVRVAAWLLAENGIEAPPHVRVSLEDMPFPGDPPGTEKGTEAARAYRDEADPWHARLAQEVAEDSDWQKLKAAGVVLHHPLAALAWIGRKAHSYAVKKQHDLLRAAAVLVARHHGVTTLGKILAHASPEPDLIIGYAKAMRESARRMPFLRSSTCWAEWTENLRLAWGRLEENVITDEETLFFLHETLLDREVTQLRSLPPDVRLLALRHVHSRKAPSALVRALQADLRLMRQLEHQRAVELWSVASLARERADLAGTAWISLVRRGDTASDRYSWLIQTSAGRSQRQGRAKSGWASLLDEMVSACGGAQRLIIAAEPGLRSLIPWPQGSHFVPSWEWAFRVLRQPGEGGGGPGEVLIPEGATAPADVPAAPAGQCILLANPQPVDASTRWVALPPQSPSEIRRSIHIGSHRLVTCQGRVRSGELAEDLVRLSLAQATGRFVVEAEDCVHGISAEEGAVPN